MTDEAGSSSEDDFLDSREDPHAESRMAEELPLLLHSIREFEPLTAELIAGVAPRTVIEVGGEDGEAAASYLRAGAARVVCVDAAPSERLRRAAEGDERLELVEARSPECLHTLPDSTFWVLDGDHNYATVRAELEAILGRGERAGHPLVLLHDVLWPWGRRDMYYDPAALDSGLVREHSWREGPSVGSEDLRRDGFVGRGAFAAALDAGGERNGVRTAIEDTLAERPELRCAIVPAIFGLAVVYSGEAPWASAVAAALLPWDRSAFLARLELNRIALYSRVLRLQHQLERRRAA